MSAKRMAMTLFPQLPLLQLLITSARGRPAAADPLPGTSLLAVFRPLEKPEEDHDPAYSSPNQRHRAAYELETNPPEDVPDAKSDRSADEDAPDPDKNERPFAHRFHQCLHASRPRSSHRKYAFQPPCYLGTVKRRSVVVNGLIWLTPLYPASTLALADWNSSSESIPACFISTSC